MVDAEENTNTKALILSSQVGLNIGNLELYLKKNLLVTITCVAMQEASNKVQEVEEQLRNLKQELEIIRYMQL